MVEFVNNREETIAKGVAKAIARHGDGVHDVRVKSPLWRVMSLITTTAFHLCAFAGWHDDETAAAVATCVGGELAQLPSLALQCSARKLATCASAAVLSPQFLRPQQQGMLCEGHGTVLRSLGDFFDGDVVHCQLAVSRKRLVRGVSGVLHVSMEIFRQKSVHNRKRRVLHVMPSDGGSR